MARTVKTYDADQVTISLGGLLIDSGYDDGEFLSIAANSEAFVLKVGTDGSATRSKTGDRSARITVSLMQSADGNALLSALLNADLAGKNGASIVPLLIKDRQGTSLYTAAKAWVVGPPTTVAFGREASGRQWVIETNDLIRVDGGN